MGKTVIQSVSYSQELQDFLDENPDLSLSKILQGKIMEIQRNREETFAEVNKLKKHILFLNDKLTEAGERIAELEKNV